MKNLCAAKIIDIDFVHDQVTIRLSREEIEKLGLKKDMTLNVSKGDEIPSLSDAYFKKTS